MSDLPSISCYCATYGRPPALLEECIESFLRQDYPGPKELVVLNDWHGCRLACDAPGVRIVNVAERAPTLGAKFNRTIALCTGELLAPWEDDDVYLPWRLSYSVERLRDGLFHTGRALYLEHAQRLVRAENLFHCNLLVHRDRMAEVGGYRHDDVSAIDVDLFARLGVRSTEIDWRDAYYVYRWSTTGSYHGSGWGGDTPVDALVVGYVQQEHAAGRLPTGLVQLRPHWTRDWVAAAHELRDAP